MMQMQSTHVWKTQYTKCLLSWKSIYKRLFHSMPLASGLSALSTWVFRDLAGRSQGPLKRPGFVCVLCSPPAWAASAVGDCPEGLQTSLPVFLLCMERK